MIQRQAHDGGSGGRGRPAMPEPGNVLTLDRVRIERGIAQRERYKYVVPRVEREGLGWKIVSPNCSRNIDPQGGEIDIAWLVPTSDGRWLLHARDHVQGCWRLRVAGLTLADALARVCADPAREFWQ
ncbi:hypothetical protein [Ideonella sp.]|uniref:DUF3024 domain-containing protein n=1 Tax=Ideonella sp. TaxID=1929293 RepID=UPI002B4896BF|nr:hypothetical protein [Ideonella sp.]HJV69244.1 hypothetical protein [Ideonella sp.]